MQQMCGEGMSDRSGVKNFAGDCAAEAHSPIPRHRQYLTETCMHTPTVKRGRRKAGAGVWFANNSDLNISTSPTGRQTSNRAELTAIILAMRRAPRWPSFYRKVVVFSDSLYCVDGVNK